MIERRFAADQEKFSTQRNVTYWLLLIFAVVCGWVLYQNDQSERSMVLQTVINLTLLAVGYWLGSSKQGQDQAQSMSRIAEGPQDLKSDDLKIDAKGAAIKIDTKGKK